jgi:hypothetical protein
MRTAFILDLGPRWQVVNLSVSTPDAIGKAYSDLLDRQVKAVASVANAQGFPVRGYTSNMRVASVEAAGISHGRRYDLNCEGLHGSVWRALTGLLLAFDRASTPLSAISLESNSAAVSAWRDQDILTVQYPSRSADINFNLSEGESPDGSIAIEIELTPGVSPDITAAIVVILNDWLEVASGGFFNDGEHPVTNAHDCPEFRRVGSRFLAAKFSGYSGAEAAFDVLLNLLRYFQSRYSCIESCQIH